ncbi:hypothetical protein BS17DRAFT_668503, partial [Gyrodon lividus]
LFDEVEKTRVLNNQPPPGHAPQLHLLDEWKINHPGLFQRKLRVSPKVFTQIVDKISTHPIFHNASNNPQLPVSIQLAIFLNAAGHYENAA